MTPTMRGLVSDDHGEDFSSDYLDHSLAKMKVVEVVVEEKLKEKEKQITPSAESPPLPSSHSPPKRSNIT